MLHSSGDDYASYTIEIYIADKFIRKDIDGYDLYTKYIDGKYLNRNYLLNQRSALNKLKILIEKEVKSYYKDK